MQCDAQCYNPTNQRKYKNHTPAPFVIDNRGDRGEMIALSISGKTTKPKFNEALNWAKSLLGLTEREKAVLKEQADRENQITGQCNPSTTTIGESTGMGKERAIKALNSLASKGYIVKIHRWQRATQYDIMRPGGINVVDNEVYEAKASNILRRQLLMQERLEAGTIQEAINRPEWDEAPSAALRWV